MVVLYGVPNFFWVTQLGQYGLGYAAVTAPGSNYKRHGHDKLGLVLGPNPHIIITLDALINTFYHKTILVYDGTELKGTPLQGVWERGVRIVEKEEIVEVDNDNSRDYWCRVQSQTRHDVHYDVHNTKDGWTCQCESYRLGHKVCQHMMAAFILAASGSRESKKKVSTNFELPERWCRHCGSTDVAWSESRLLKRMSTSEGAGVDRCSCNTCGRRFADRPGFEGRHYTEDIILFAIRLVARNMLPKDVARTIKDEKNVTVSERTIQRWVDEYPRIVAAFAKNLEIKECNAVSVDEKHYKSRGKARWLARAMCMATRFIVASDHWPDKLNHDATPLLEKVVERLGGPPLLLLSDKLRGYKKGYNNTMGAKPQPVTMHISDVSINNRHVNNNQHERHNGDIERRKKGSRGFNSDIPGLFVLDEIHHNFLRPHMGLGEMTPAEKAGITIPGPDKLLTLIRCAAASRFNFA